MSMYLPILRLSVEQRFAATDATRLSTGMSVIVIGALSILCWAVLVGIVLAAWELL